MTQVRAGWWALTWAGVVLATGMVGAGSAGTMYSRSASGAEQEASASQVRTIVVVPFANISGQPSDDWIGSGIAATVRADLQQLETLSVSIVGREALGREIARDLGISWTVEGGVQRLGDQLRITARIVDVETGTTQGNARVDGNISDLFLLQDRLVSDLIRAFDRLTGTPEVERVAGGGVEPRQPVQSEPGVATRPGGGGLSGGASTTPPLPEPAPARQRGLDLGIGVGAAFPALPDSFRELFYSGFSVSVDASRQIVGVLGWRVAFGHDRTSLAGADLNIDFARYGGGITLEPFDRESRGIPYGFFTVGGFTTNVRGAEAPDVGAETDVGISLGGGYKWRVGDRWGVGGNVRVNGVFGGSGDDGGDDDGPVWYLTPSVGVFLSF